MVNQIALTCGNDSTAPGHIHWNMKALLRNPNGVADLLRDEAYRDFALVPASAWLGHEKMETPLLFQDGRRARWQSKTAEPRWWLVQTRRGKVWSARLLPGNQRSMEVDAAADTITVRGVNREGALSEVTSMEWR